MPCSFSGLRSHVCLALQDDRGVLHTFTAPSAFSLFVLRLDTPKRQSSAGWKDVMYEGRPLGSYRGQLDVSPFPVT